MIVILMESFGNHANRLWQDANLRAFCLNKGWIFFNPTLQNIWESRRIGRRVWGAGSDLVYRVLRKLASWSLIQVQELESGFLTGVEALRPQILFVHGWAFRDEEAIRAHRLPLLARHRMDRLFPQRSERSSASQLLEKRTKVGVHIRRGDYRDWEGGRYYYEDAVYLQKIIELEHLIEAPVEFFLFSNEPVKEEFYRKEGRELVVSRNSWQEDLFLMASCQYLIGPPSTFTMWASFMGNVPTFHIRQPEQALDFADFRIFPQVGQ